VATGSIRPALHRGGFIIAALSLVVGAALLAPRAASAFVPLPETQPGHLSLHSEPASLQFHNLSPGMVSYGHLRLDLSGADTADLTLQSFGEGPLFEHTAGITMMARLCEDEWVDVPGATVAAATTPDCPGEDMLLAMVDDPRPMADMHTALSTAIGTITAGDPRFILVELRMPDTASSYDESLMGQSGQFALRVLASGDDPATTTPGTTDPGVTNPGDPNPNVTGRNVAGPAAPSGDIHPTHALPATGVDILGAALCAAGAIALGLLARRRRAQNGTD
jgi:hypothetical protein